MRSLAMIAVLACASAAVAGPDWTEIPDARKLLPAQVIPFSPVNSTTGALVGIDAAGGADTADLYQVTTTAPGSKVNTGTLPLALRREANFDTLLVLFDTTGHAIVANDDAAPGTTSSEITIASPGTYVLAIAAKGTQPVSTSGNMFNFGGPGAQFAQLPPNGPGGALPLSGWTGTPVDPEPRNYVAYFIDANAVPTLSEWGLMALAGGFMVGAVVVLRRGAFFAG